MFFVTLIITVFISWMSRSETAESIKATATLGRWRLVSCPIDLKEILHSDVLLICKTCMCGRQDLQSAAAQGTRIVGGMESEANEFPWKVTIFPVMKTATPQMRCTGQVSLEKTGADHKCGASLISPFHLLTAAHCVIDPGEESISPGCYFGDRVGRPQSTKHDDSSAGRA